MSIHHVLATMTWMYANKFKFKHHMWWSWFAAEANVKLNAFCKEATRKGCSMIKQVTTYKLIKISHVIVTSWAGRTETKRKKKKISVENQTPICMPLPWWDDNCDIYPPSSYPEFENLTAVCSYENLKLNHHQPVIMVHLMEELSEQIEVKERKHKTPFASIAINC